MLRHPLCRYLPATLLAVLFLLVLQGSSAVDDSYTPDRTEERAEFNLINKMRANPAAYTQELGVNLDSVMAQPALVWNDTLAKVAETKVIDMATRGYFAHVDPDGFGINHYLSKAGYSLEASWTKEDKLNYFESIQAGAHDGEDAVKSLIIDKYSADLGHRKAILGMTTFKAACNEIGIGFIRCKEGCKYRTYTSIIIAMHREKK